MSQEHIQTKSTAEGLLIVNDGGFADQSTEWKATRVSQKRIMIFDSQSSSGLDESGRFASCSSEMLYDLLLGANRRRWTGMLLIDVGFAKKKLYFAEGECVFAASDLMDDRLGEVIYREAVISMEQLANFAVQVDRKTKFGQVLLRSGNFNNTDLWNSLKYQVREILFSVFLVDHSYVEISQHVAPVEVSFEGGTDSLIETAFSYGFQFKAFTNRIDPDRVKVSPGVASLTERVKEGTFIGDFVELCKDGPTINDMLSRSKLTHLNTFASLQRLAAKGYLQFEGIGSATMIKIEGADSKLKSTIDGYQVLHQIVSSTFSKADLTLPLHDLSEFALSLNSGSDAAIYLDATGALLADSVSDILQQCAANPNRIPYFKNRLSALTRYLLQFSSDFLPTDLARNIQREFREIVS